MPNFWIMLQNYVFFLLILSWNVTWRFCEIHSISILGISQLHCPKTSTATDKLNQLYISILFSEFHLSIIEGVFFPLLHECDYLGRLIRQTLIKNFTLLPWVEEWLFLKCLIYVLFLKSVSYGRKHLWAHGILVAPEKTFVSAYPTLLPSNTLPPPLHFPVGWPVTVQMLAKATTKSLVIIWINQLLNIASPNGRVLTSPLAAVSCGIFKCWIISRSLCSEANVHEVCFSSTALLWMISIFHCSPDQHVVNQTDCKKMHTGRKKQKQLNVSVWDCTSKQELSDVKVSRCPREPLDDFYPKMHCSLCPSRSLCSPHTRLTEQKEPHEWNLVRVQHVGCRFSLMYPWCQNRTLAKCISTIDIEMWCKALQIN